MLQAGLNLKEYKNLGYKIQVYIVFSFNIYIYTIHTWHSKS